MRSYMEMDPDAFEKLTTLAQNEEKQRNQKQKDTDNRWAKLE